MGADRGLNLLGPFLIRSRIVIYTYTSAIVEPGMLAHLCSNHEQALYSKA
jgi:hypothetical protein